MYVLQLGPKELDAMKTTPVNPIKSLVRCFCGYAGAFYFCFVVPVYMWIKHTIVPEGMAI